MRQYIGLTKEGKWVYGDLLHSDVNAKKVAIVPIWTKFTGRLWKRVIMQTVVEVLPETVGQYAGLQDKHGKEIYEGDIVTSGDNFNSVVCFGDNHETIGFYLKETGTMKSEACPREHNLFAYTTPFEVIGNIHLKEQPHDRRRTIDLTGFSQD